MRPPLNETACPIIKYIPLQQGLRQYHTASGIQGL